MAAIQQHQEAPQDAAAAAAGSSSRRKESRRQRSQAKLDRTSPKRSEEGQRLTRKKSVRMSKSFDETTTSTPKRKTTTKKQPVKRDMSGSSRRSTTPAVANTDERRRSPSRSPVRQRTCVQTTSSPFLQQHQQKRRQRSARSNSPSGSSSPRSVRDQIYDGAGLTAAAVEPANTAPPPPITWLCTCGEENEGNQLYCGMCGTGKTWQCADCDFANKCKFRFCGRCGIPKKVKTAHEQDEEEEEEEEEHETTVLAPNQWKCQGCEMVNPCPYVFCSMCGSSKLPEDYELENLNASFPPPFVTCRPEDALDESLRSLESWTGEQ